MKLLCFSILYVFAVFQCGCEQIMKDGRIQDIRCEQNQGESFVSKIPTGWRGNYIYPVQLCATVKGERPVKCKDTKYSRLDLIVRSRGIRYANILTAPISPDNFASSDTYCHVFTAKQIAGTLKGTVEHYSYISAEVWLHGNPGPNTNKAATLQLHVRVAPFYFDGPGNFDFPTGDYMLYAVVCDFPNCKLTAEGPHEIKATEYLRKKKKSFPTYEEGDCRVTGATFSVTTIQCSKAGCPTKVTAT